MSASIGRRLVLDVCHGASDTETLRTAAEFARLLSLDLHCLFIEDEALLTMADLPFAREIRLPDLQWTALDPTSVADQLRTMATQTRRRVNQVLKDLGLPDHFEIIRGDPAICIGGVCRLGDVIILTEPATPTAFGLKRVREAAHASSASVLLLPQRHRFQSGPVTVVLSGPADGALEQACRIAMAAGQSVTVLVPATSDRAAEATLADQARRLGLPDNRLSIRPVPGTGGQSVRQAIGLQKVSLVVLKRNIGRQADITADLDALRDLPILLLDGE